MASMVVLPDPLGPTSPMNSPRFTLSETSLTAVTALTPVP